MARETTDSPVTATPLRAAGCAVFRNIRKALRAFMHRGARS
jgi:hypothetical protein